MRITQTRIAAMLNPVVVRHVTPSMTIRLLSARAGRASETITASPRLRKKTIVLRLRHGTPLSEIGRTKCRESVCQYVLISVVAGSFKKKHPQQQSRHRLQL